MFIFLSIVAAIAAIALTIMRMTADEGSPMKGKRVGLGRTALIFAFLAFGALGIFNKVFFYADAGYIYHVRTLAGQEKAVDGGTNLGYNMYLFGHITKWKRAMTVQAVLHTSKEDVNAEEGGLTSSANLPPMNIVFLDQVDADATATARFLLPTDPTAFLKMAREYRTPGNLLNTALVPAFKETLNATASLMSAEEYYSGGRTEFNNEFSNQLENGIYIVERHEIIKKRIGGPVKGSANASKGTEQEDFGSDQQTVFVVEKLKDDEGMARRKHQQFTNYGIVVVDSRITDMQPNKKFTERMQLKQQASADRAIAREQRIQEEQQKLLVEAKGARQVAERQAKWKADQIEQTTQAETARQLVVTAARKMKDKADIDKATAAVLLDKATIDAKAVKVAADAQAYKKRVILKADNALAQKLDAEIEIQTIWADAYSKRAVPQYVFGGGGTGGSPVGSDSEAHLFMKLMTIDAAKRLTYDRGLDTSVDKATAPAQTK